MEKISLSGRDGNGWNKKVMVLSPCELDGWTERSDGYWALKAAWPNSFGGPRYPASGRESHNNLIEKIFVGVMEIVKIKKTKVISPCELEGSREGGVG